MIHIHKNIFTRQSFAFADAGERPAGYVLLGIASNLTNDQVSEVVAIMGTPEKNNVTPLECLKVLVEEQGMSMSKTAVWKKNI